MDIEFYNADHGVALSNLNSGSSAIYITSNAGASWELCSPLNFSVQDLCYANEYTLYAVGSNEGIARSMNGGYGWTQIYSGSNDRFFMGVDFVEQFGVIGGEDGKIFHTLDGGENWSTYATGYHNLQGVHVFNADSAYIGGTDEDVYKTIDEGENWTVEDNGIGSSHIYKVKFAYDGTGFLCGSQGMIKRKEASGVLLVDFEADKTLICNWEQVDFFDLSIGAIDSWEWYFEGGNPSNSTEQNPQVYFTSPGIYDVSLIVTSNGQQYELIKENYITSDFCPAYKEQNKNLINISPNPAINTFQIKGLTSEGAKIKIFDIGGKVVQNNIFDGSLIDISKLQPGLYFIQIVIDGKRFIRQKLIIE